MLVFFLQEIVCQTGAQVLCIMLMCTHIFFHALKYVEIPEHLILNSDKKLIIRYCTFCNMKKLELA
jgi:hypothetical protein